jgi:hypothetical protein
MTTAYDTIEIARTVLIYIGIPNRNQHKMAVNINSRALANVFNMEFKFLRKKLVMIPIAALLNMMMMTLNWNTDAKESRVKAPKRLPWQSSIPALHTIESTYMKTFWTYILTPAPTPFNRYSLYTPAKHEHNVCK